MGWLGNYRYRVPITIDHTKVSSNISHFPIALILDSSAGIGSDDITFIFDELTSNSKKIAITLSDGITQIYGEIEAWNDTTEKAVIWVSRSSLTLSSSSDTTIYFYFDSSMPDNTDYIGDVGSTPGQNVWDSDFVAVFHLSEDPSANGGVDAVKDSTQNGYDATSYGSMTSGDLVDGKIGKGLEFDGSDDRAYSSVGGDDISSNLTLEAVINHSVLNQVASQRYLTIMSETACIRHSTNTTNDLHFFIKTDGTLRHLYNDVLSTSTDYYVAGTWDGTTQKIILDTTVIDSQTPGGSLSTPNGEIRISAGESMNGIMSEIRASKIARSKAWTDATRHTIWDNLITWGGQEYQQLDSLSMPLSAYARKNEDIKMDLRAHDGLELRFLKMVLEAVIYISRKDLSLPLSVLGLNKKSISLALEAILNKFKNMKMNLEAVDGNIFKNLKLILQVTDGTILKNVKLNVKVINATPVFKSVTAHRLDSVLHEVS